MSARVELPHLRCPIHFDVITYLMIAGGIVAGWAVLQVMAGERQRQENEKEVAQQIAEEAAKLSAKSKQKSHRKAA